MIQKMKIMNSSAKKFRIKRGAVIIVPILLLSFAISSCREKTVSKDIIRSPLKVSSANPRYFADKNGKIVYLTGSHVWCNLVDIGASDPPESFDFSAYLDWMKRYNHNFMRLWAWESLKWNSVSYNPDKTYNVYPHPWKRTGPGIASDGKPKFDLTELDQEYFNRMRSRIDSASKRGIYVSVMLFEGWGMQFATNSWKNHPFHPDNNVNGLDADINGDGNGLEIYTLSVPEITTIEEKYVKKVIDEINDLDNVLYEISNENHHPSTRWQYHFIDFIHNYEKTKAKQHPVGMTFQYKGGSNDTLMNSKAEWISPNPFKGGIDLRNNPPANDGKKVILFDTDHLWGIGGDGPWVWKSFVRGMNPIFMDTYDGKFLGTPFEPKFEPIRKNMGYTLMYAQKMNLARAVPNDTLSSTSFCLADPGNEYLVYQPLPDSTFRLNIINGDYMFEWFNPASGMAENTGEVKIKDKSMSFKAPFSGDVVLYLKAIH